MKIIPKQVFIKTSVDVWDDLLFGISSLVVIIYNIILFRGIEYYICEYTSMQYTYIRLVLFVRYSSH